jgi:hypothetical protein
MFSEQSHEAREPQEAFGLKGHGFSRAALGSHKSDGFSR